MARFKDFGKPFDSESAEKITFKIYDEEFHCFPEMQGRTLLEFVRLSQSEDTTDSAIAMEKFFEKVLFPESYERFDALAKDPERIVSVSTLAEIVSWIVSQYTDRPTEGSEQLPTGE